MSRDFGNITDAIQGAQGGQTSWLREPYVGRVEIKKIKYSEDAVKNGKPYTGTPYFKYLVITKPASGESYMTEILLWRPSKNDTEEKANNKLAKIKGLYDSCGIDSKLSGQEYLEAILGKECNMVIQMQEKALLQSKPPKIINNPTYWFSKPVDEFIEITQDKLFWRLSEAEHKKFLAASDKYNKAHPEEAENKSMTPNANFESEEETDDNDF
jgi:hypothetical protein